MILQALTEYYEALADQGKLSPPGWDDAFQVSYGLELAEDGALLDLISYLSEQPRGKKTVPAPQRMRVPAHPTRSFGILANLLCDNSGYLLGADAKGKPQRTKECFAACAALHRQVLADVDTPAARAVLAFFDAWRPDDAPQHPLLAPCWEKIAGNANLIFCYGMKPVTKDRAIADAWQRYYERTSAEGDLIQCLVTGRQEPLARLHPMFHGVRGAQSSGAALVSFNTSSLNSYGHEQGENAQVGAYAAFAYGAALSALLGDKEHCQLIGDTTVVCWAQHGEPVYQDAGLAALFGPPEGVTDQELRALLGKLARGEPAQWRSFQLQPEEHFYILGLAPNASRLSVRFFLRDTFGDFMKHVEQHYKDIAIDQSSFNNQKTVLLWPNELLAETVNQKLKSKVAKPQLNGDLLRAILTGGPYPATLLNGVHLRIRAEHEVTPGRAAIIKGYYLRLARIGRPQISEEVLQMSLNESCPDIYYAMGRLFATYEKIQLLAYPRINATIRDKYFSSASATPASIFPIMCPPIWPARPPAFPRRIWRCCGRPS